MSLGLSFYNCKMNILDKNTWFLNILGLLLFESLMKVMALLPTKNVHIRNMTWIL